MKLFYKTFQWSSNHCCTIHSFIIIPGDSEKGKSLVALKEEATGRRRMLHKAAQEAGE